ncbi:universal stress protein [Parapedobacter pyrenivorans]|uniref:universal stress protein n=1 Tax=Parapedobacter pyrenivorans TaxID=1305674 RepID=UPI00334046B9
MKTILVPTDFSENAFVAAEYACALANESKQKVQLLHVYIALYAGYGEEGNSVKQIKWAETESAEAMKTLVENLSEQFPQVEIEGECLKGFMIDIVVDKLKRNENSLVVMGTKGATNITESILGSTTYEVIKKSPVPVLVVPIDTPDFSFQRVGFFTAYDDHELDALMVFQRALNLRPHLSMLHFYKEGEKAPDKELERWQRKVEAAYPDWGVSCKATAVEKVDINAVTREAKSENLDLLAFARPHKSFFQKIFVTSLTKAVANYPTIPSLFIKT